MLVMKLNVWLEIGRSSIGIIVAFDVGVVVRPTRALCTGHADRDANFLTRPCVGWACDRIHLVSIGPDPKLVARTHAVRDDHIKVLDVASFAGRCQRSMVLAGSITGSLLPRRALAVVGPASGGKSDHDFLSRLGIRGAGHLEALAFHIDLKKHTGPDVGGNLHVVVLLPVVGPPPGFARECGGSLLWCWRWFRCCCPRRRIPDGDFLSGSRVRRAFHVELVSTHVNAEWHVG